MTTLLQPEDTFTIQFVWRLNEGNFVRAYFEARVLETQPKAEKYLVQLDELLAGQEEGPGGVILPKADMSLPYWAMVVRLIGRKVLLAAEVADGRPVRLRLATLMGVHNFFYRYE
ncbi:MAG: hypothetical protein R6X32_17465 [Chloroflexota bacterium]